MEHNNTGHKYCMLENGHTIVTLNQPWIKYLKAVHKPSGFVAKIWSNIKCESSNGGNICGIYYWSACSTLYVKDKRKRIGTQQKNKNIYIEISIYTLPVRRLLGAGALYFWVLWNSSTSWLSKSGSSCNMLTSSLILVICLVSPLPIVWYKLCSSGVKWSPASVSRSICS
jgi:hypothetical protein